MTRVALYARYSSDAQLVLDRGPAAAMPAGDLGTILGWLGHKASKPPSKTRACRYRWLR